MSYETVKCAICGCEKKTLTRHIKTVHNMSIEEYQELYPNSEIISQQTKDNRSKAGKKTFDNPENIERVRKMCKDKWSDPEQRKKLSEVSRETKLRQWKDIEYRKHISECSSKQMKEQWKGKEFRESQSNRISNMMKDKWNDDEYRSRKTEELQNMWNNVEYRNKYNISMIRRSINIENRINLNNGWISKIYNEGISKRDGSIHIKNGIYNYYVYRSEKFNREFLCRSNAELRFIKLCNRLSDVYSLDYEPYIIHDEYYHIYIPDYLVNNKYIIEVKSDIEYDKGEFRREDMVLDYCDKNNLKFIWLIEDIFDDIINLDDLLKYEVKRINSN